MRKIIKKYEQLLSHLNAEENDLAIELNQDLTAFLGEVAIMQLRLAKLDALEAGGVDNWVGYDSCFEDEDDE